MKEIHIKRSDLLKSKGQLEITPEQITENREEIIAELAIAIKEYLRHKEQP